VDRVAAEASDTLLLAEAFWLMEGYFVRTLGMHRVYNSAFMNMLKMEENAKYRQTIKNVLEFNPEVLKRFVNFMNNPDEKTAVEQFGKENKYFGACLLLVTMPGLPMLGHGQVEGFHEKYGMEYKRAYWSEPVDEHLVREHERLIFPLMRRRWLFSGADSFVLYDFWANGQVNEDVFAYSNRAGDSRAIILYHNRFASTRGWIRTSTSFAVKGDDGEMVLRQTTLSDSLGFKGDGRHYYLYRDYASGLEYIRNGRELCEQGLLVTLEAYEFHAFMDFREVWDDEFGTWGTLCHQLQGGPVPDLDEEVKQIRFAGLIGLLKSLLEQNCGLLTGAFAELDSAGLKESRARFATELSSFYVALAELAELSAPTKTVTARILKELAAVEAIAEVEPILAGVTARLLAFAWLCLHNAGAPAIGTGAAEDSAGLVSRFGLDRPLQELLYGEATVGDDPLSCLDVPALMSLWNALLRWQDLLLEKQVSPAPLLADRNVSFFLLRHSSGGFEWIIKERWELLIDWLLLTAAINLPGSPAKRTPAAVRKAAAALRVAADKAQYRVDLLLGLYIQK